jgi:hypothetical protein
MISRLVTVDVLLTVCQHLGQLPECKGRDLKELYDISKPILNEWAQRIEREGLSVSLQAIIENTFLFTQPNTSIKSALDLGHQMIDCAGRLESFLCERGGQSFQIQWLQEFETAVNDERTVEWFKGAKEITGVKNPTDASDNLKKALAWFLKVETPPKNSPLRNFLSEATNGKRPDIPLAFVSLFRDGYYLRFRKLFGA